MLPEGWVEMLQLEHITAGYEGTASCGRHPDRAARSRGGAPRSNGAGKTTLLRVAAGQLDPCGGGC